MTAMAKMIEISRRGVILADNAENHRTHRTGGGSDVRVSVGVAYSPIVQAVQSALVAAGYDVGSDGADGKLGPNTVAAIKKYQKDHGMTPTGSIEDATRDMAAAAAGSTTAAVVSTPAGKAVSKEIAASVAKDVVKDVAKDMTLPLVIGGVVVLLVGVAVWALTRKVA